MKKYKDSPDKQAEPIIEYYYNDDLKMFWDKVIFINMVDENNPKFYDIKLIDEKSNVIFLKQF